MQVKYIIPFNIMNTHSFLRVARILLVSLLISSPCLCGAKDGTGHVSDMIAVFGLQKHVNAPEVKRHFTALTQCIDCDWTGLNYDVKQIVKYYCPGASEKFTSSSYKHRLYFHWGYTRKAQASSVLADLIDKATEGIPASDAALCKQEIYHLINEKWRQRKASFLTIVGYLTSSQDPLPLKENIAIARIIYDTHIVGDYIVGVDITQKAILPRKDLYEDIVSALNVIRNEEGQGFSGVDEIRFLKAKLRDAAYGGSNHDSGVNMLKAMTTYIPIILRKAPKIKKGMKLDDLPDQANPSAVDGSGI